YFVAVRRPLSVPLLRVDSLFAADDLGYVCSHFVPSLDYPLNGEEAFLRSGCVPVSLLLSEEGTRIILSMAAHVENAAEAQPVTYEELAEFHNRVLFPLAGYDVPMIRLSRETASACV